MNETKRLVNDFRDGDIIVDRNYNGDGFPIAILKGDFNEGSFADYAGIDYENNLAYGSDDWYISPTDWDFATEDEKQLLFDRMFKEDNVIWNAKTKRIENCKNINETLCFQTYDDCLKVYQRYAQGK